jgi:hypothetical protein
VCLNLKLGSIIAKELVLVEIKLQEVYFGFNNSNSNCLEISMSHVAYDLQWADAMNDLQE